MMRPIERVEVNMKVLVDILERAKTGPLTDEECEKLRAALETLVYVTGLVGDKDTTINKLRQILFGASTEKTRNIFKKNPEGTGAEIGTAARTEQRAAPNHASPMGHSGPIRLRTPKGTGATAPHLTPARRRSEWGMSP